MPEDDRRMQLMAEHVAYEAFMLARTTQLLEAGTTPPVGAEQAVVIRNALLESALLHLRVLDDFLCLKSRTRADDVVAMDFLPSWTPQTGLSEGERQYVNKRVMHLTTTRGEGPAPWELARFREVFQTFVALLHQLELAAPERAAWFRRWLDW